MADDSIISGSLQETILTSLVFFTDENTKIIAGLCDINWFEDPYREIVAKILEYWRQEGKAPDEGHIVDVLDQVLKNPEHRKYNTYTRVMTRVVRLKQTLNTKYVYSRLFEFARRQNLKRAIFEAGTILSQSEDSADYDKVESILSDVSKFQYNNYDLGFSLAETTRSLSFLDKEEEEDRLLLTIPELDIEGINPGRGELFLIIAPRGRGKSMFMHHVGRCVMVSQRWNALHITLENSERATAQRYLQGRFALTTRETNQGIIMFARSDDGKVASFEALPNPAAFKMRDEQRPFLEDSIKYWEDYNYQMSRLRIKGFPTGDLTYDKLEAFLDHLEAKESFVPSLLIVDYPDLMAYDIRHDPRFGIGRLYQQLRGLAGKRDIAVVVASQSNREGETVRLVETQHTAEDISKIATADYVITYNQTKAEQALGIARLYVAKARNERQWFTVLISQNYSASQFCIDSARMTNKSYKDILDRTPEKEEC